MKVTSALANKIIKQLENDKAYILDMESDSTTYVAALGEEPVIPEYDYGKVNKDIEEIDQKIAKIKHAVNITNSTNSVETEEGMLTIDAILIRMAQMNRRRYTLATLRRRVPKMRLESTSSWRNVSKAPEYRYANYDIEQVKEDYDVLCEKIQNMQLVLDAFNQTFEFEIED